MATKFGKVVEELPLIKLIDPEIKKNWRFCKLYFQRPAVLR